ncbi:RND family efflux pump outer membrane lipoprotein [Thermotomaculum hydrothermale]|uniref:RND family efflux pump outer membrane lipoprotein n=1 Tax=Thermotomaculum hydrothermale TaxID=981385 RepID=A0A7R6PPZ9_9BACT|nr:TolC family protein [Thermotomaculum hydrothermale]BBB32231.1 RND family efflux pump outer membrane lipoprotein [Thermotomaculum hydrothermale]
MIKKIAVLFAIIVFFQVSCNLAPEVEEKKITPEKESFVNSKKQNKKLGDLNWWNEFNDKNLNTFILDAQKNSLDFKNADLTVEKFKLLYRVSKSNFWPNISLSTGAMRNKTNLRTFLPQGGAFKNTTYSFTFDASYEIDLFNKLKNERKQSLYSFLNMEQTQKSLKLSIIANATSLYLKYSELKKEIKNTEKTIEVYKIIRDTAYKNYLDGVYPSETFLLAENQLNQLENTLNSLKQNKIILEQSIKNILSKHNASIKTTDFDKLKREIKPLNPGLPSELLLRRPDVLASYLDVKAKASSVGINKANLFPSIKLTASDGFKTTELSLLLNQKSNVWNFGINIFQPIFNRGALRNKLKISKKDLEIAINNYKKTVINAFTEVDSLLEQYETITIQINSEKKAVSSLKTILDKKKKDYINGTDTLENYLNQKIAYINEKNKLDRLYLNLLLNRVSLYKALGGGVNLLKNNEYRGEK